MEKLEVRRPVAKRPNVPRPEIYPPSVERPRVDTPSADPVEYMTDDLSAKLQASYLESMRIIAENSRENRRRMEEALDAQLIGVPPQLLANHRLSSLANYDLSTIRNAALEILGERGDSHAVQSSDSYSESEG